MASALSVEMRSVISRAITEGANDIAIFVAVRQACEMTGNPGGKGKRVLQ